MNDNEGNMNYRYRDVLWPHRWDCINVELESLSQPIIKTVFCNDKVSICWNDTINTWLFQWSIFDVPTIEVIMKKGQRNGHIHRHVFRLFKVLQLLLIEDLLSISLTETYAAIFLRFGFSGSHKNASSSPYWTGQFSSLHWPHHRSHPRPSVVSCAFWTHCGQSLIPYFISFNCEVWIKIKTVLHSLNRVTWISLPHTSRSILSTVCWWTADTHDIAEPVQSHIRHTTRKHRRILKIWQVKPACKHLISL